METIKRHTYKTVLEKKILINSYNVPDFYRTTNNAKLDIQMVIEKFDLDKTLAFGVHELEVTIIYKKGKDNIYYPEISKPKIKKLDVGNLYPSPQRELNLTFTQALKLAFRILFKRTLDKKVARHG